MGGYMPPSFCGIFMDRRHLLKLLGILGIGGYAQAQSQNAPSISQADIDKLEADHLKAMNQYPEFMSGRKLKIGLMVYPGMFLMDLIGPLTVFEALMNRDIYLIWKNKEPVNNQPSPYTAFVPIIPSMTFKECPNDLDILFVPGGVPATLQMMEDAEVIEFLKDKGKTAKYITSVCTGSLILGAAGLLKGYRATSHWATLDALAPLGAIPSKARVVMDRNRITGGGVTAGIDFGLTLVSLLRNKEYAQAIQLYLEYNPKPPFNAGSPETAPIKVKQFVSDMFAGVRRASVDLSKKLGRGN